MKLENKMYYNPDDLENLGGSLRSVPHYIAVVEFLKAFENLVPEAMRELQDNVLPLLTPEVIRTIRDEQKMHRDTSEIDIILSSSSKPLLFFRNALVSWARHYNLLGPNNLYVDIAYRAMAYHVWRASVTDMLLEGMTNAIGQFLPQTELPEQPISMLDGVSLERARDPLFDVAFPFVFTPSRSMMERWGIDEDGLRTKVLELDWMSPAHYESLYQHDNTLGNVFSGKLPAEELQGQFKPYWTGIGWDPLSGEKWEDFEAKMEQAFANYKSAYKNRMMNVIETLGLKESAPKEALYHFEWLVLNKVLGKKHREIADYHLEQTGIVRGEDAVQKQIRKLSKLVSLS